MNASNVVRNFQTNQTLRNTNKLTLLGLSASDFSVNTAKGAIFSIVLAYEST